MRYAFVAEHQGQFGVRSMCRCLRIQPSGFYVWLKSPLSQRAREGARQAGSLDVGVETLRVEHAEVVEDIVLRTDRRTGATSHLLQLALKTRARPISLERVLERRDYADGCILLQNAKRAGKRPWPNLRGTS